MDDSIDARPCVRILGTRGVPAAYGGFETAAENVAQFLVARGWKVVVYCQSDHDGPPREDAWEGVDRVLISVPDTSWLGTSKFDWLSIRHAAEHRDLCLTFGYNTAIFNIRQRARGIPNIINMDGIEWSRSRWGPLKQAILYANERIGCWVGNELIADHPELNTYLRTRAPARKITTIAYGAHRIIDSPTDALAQWGLEPGRYFTLIARPIPENSILELIQGFSAQRRGVKLAILGDYLPEEEEYHRAVVDAASDEVTFLGAVYDPKVVTQLRFHSLGYLHGHTVGGTNPSLVEALAAGNAVIAHDNKYNSWVAGEAGLYFTSSTDVDQAIDRLLRDEALRQQLGNKARARYESEFTWEKVAGEYEALLRKAIADSDSKRTRKGLKWSTSQ